MTDTNKSAEALTFIKRVLVAGIGASADAAKRAISLCDDLRAALTAPAAAQPLTLEQVGAMADQIGAKRGEAIVVLAAVRETERAHGIGAAPAAVQAPQPINTVHTNIASNSQPILASAPPPAAQPKHPSAMNDAERAEWLADKICNGGDYAKEAAGLLRKFAAPPAAATAEALTTCNCRWKGDRLVQQCTLHEAWKDAIHEWAERAKTAERKLETLTATEQAAPDEEGLTAAYLSGVKAGKAAPDLDELHRAVCAIGIVGQIDGHEVIRRESALDIIDFRRAAAQKEST